MASVELTFDYRHYVPILRQKPAEMEALQFLFSQDKGHVTPLLELPPTLLEKYGKHLGTPAFFVEITKWIAITWGYAPLFIDVELLSAKLISNQVEHPLWEFSEAARNRGLRIIPVTGLNRSQDHQAAVAKAIMADSRGVCVRLSEPDLSKKSLERELQRLLVSLNVEPNQVDILVDLKLIGEHPVRLIDLSKRLPLLSSWRTFTVASGAFPKDLSDLEKNRQHQLTRSDWLNWFNQVKRGPALPRRPSFSDYTIQHPHYSPPRDVSNISASIRYTADQYWVIMRGEGVLNDKGPGYAQYWANAQLLSDRPEFSGPSFSQGDDYIYKMGQQTAKTGNARTWLEAGINHHLTFVARQIANLFGSSSDGVPGNGSGPPLRTQSVSRISSREVSSARLQPVQLPLIS